MVRMISKTNCGDIMWNLNWVIISSKKNWGYNSTFRSVSSDRPQDGFLSCWRCREERRWLMLEDRMAWKCSHSWSLRQATFNWDSVLSISSDCLSMHFRHWASRSSSIKWKEVLVSVSFHFLLNAGSRSPREGLHLILRPLGRLPVRDKREIGNYSLFLKFAQLLEKAFSIERWHREKQYTNCTLYVYKKKLERAG